MVNFRPQTSGTPGKTETLCTFETVAGDVFTLARPPITLEQEEQLIEQLRQILDDEGGL